MKYIKQFIVGSSFLVFAPFYYGYNKLKKDNYSYYKYTFVAPLWFGLWNIISLILADYFNLSIQNRFLLISVISYSVIISINTYNNVYNFTTEQWVQYYIGMLFLYLIVWNIIIYQIEKQIS